MEKIKVLVAEDHKMFRDAISERIAEASSRIDIVGKAGNGLEVVEILKTTIPDIILLDIYMPEMTGWQVLEVLKVDYPNVKAVMFSGEFDMGHVGQAIIGGAAAFVDKWKSDEKDIVAAIEGVYDYGYYFNDIVSQEIIIQLNKKKLAPLAGEEQEFTDREREVIDQICDGKQVKEIAAALNISIGTVKHHKNNVYKKTTTSSNVDLLKYCINKGIYNVFQYAAQKRGSINP